MKKKKRGFKITGRALTVEKAYAGLRKRGCVFSGRYILIPEKNRMGNGSWGLVDFFVRIKKLIPCFIDKDGKKTKKLIYTLG